MKRVAIVVLLLVVVFTAACGSRAENPDGSRISDRNYRVGTQGVEIEFLNNAPPDRIFAGDNLEIIIEVRNEGSYPTEESVFSTTETRDSRPYASGGFEGQLFLYGFDESAFEGERWDGSSFISSDLEGRSQFSPQGRRENKQYRVNRVRTPFGTESYSPTIIAAICYKYRTIAEPKVCIDPEPYTVFDEDKVCTLNQNGQTYSLGSQGAPVAVTRVTQEVSSNHIHFEIEIRNVGTGKVVDDNVRNDCPFELDYNDVNRVVARARLPYDGAPNCQPAGTLEDPVRLDESGRGTIFCSFRKPGDTGRYDDDDFSVRTTRSSVSAFETNLRIELDYRYLDTIQKRVEIVNLDR